MSIRFIVAAAAFALVPWSVAHTQEAAPRAKVELLSCDPLPELPGKSVATVRVAFPVGAKSAPHRHPGSVTAYVLRGSVKSQLNGGPVRTYAVGETWFEPSGAVHAIAESASETEPAELLAVMVAGEGCGGLSEPVGDRGAR